MQRTAPALPVARSPKVMAVAVFSVAFLFYAFVYIAIMKGNEPFPKYPDFARQVLAQTAARERIVDFSPLYLGVHLAARSIAGDPSNAVVWTQLLLTAASAAFLFVLIRPLFGSAAALAGAALFIASPAVVTHASLFEPEAFLVFFILGFLACVMRPSVRMALAAGVFMGCALWTRLNLAPVVCVVPLFFALDRRNNRRWVRRSLLFLAPALSALLLLSARNYQASGEFSPTVMNPGFVFYDGNNPGSYGHTVTYPPVITAVIGEFEREVDPPHAIYRLLPRRITGKALSTADANAYWAGKAFAYLRDHPAAWCKTAIRKVLFALHTVRWHDTFAAMENDRAARALPLVPFGGVTALALVGVVLTLGVWRRLLVVYAVVICQMAVMLATYASERQRVAIVAVVVLFAAAALTFFFSGTVRMRRRVAAGGAAFLFFLLFFFKTGEMRDIEHQRERFDSWQRLMFEARIMRDRGALVTASDKNAAAHAMAPYIEETRLWGLAFPGTTFEARTLEIAESFRSAHERLSGAYDRVPLYLANNDPDSAIKLLDVAINDRHPIRRVFSQPSEPLYYRALVALRSNRPAAAREYLDRGLKQSPGDPWLLSLRAAASGDNRFRALITRYYSEVDAAYFMGRAYYALERFSEAAGSFSYLTEKLPEYRDGLVYHALALGRSGEIEPAVRLIREALRRRPEPLFREADLLAIAQRHAQMHPDDVAAQELCGDLLKSFGRYDEALAIYHALEEKEPSRASVRLSIDWLARAAGAYAR
ncbi:MAG: glycosyltransferase family 39 protein [Chitinispirillaceae bacterium]|nr:glycosyltransferase family 39 protein [Chitinispirillaceae bacterium]